MPGIQVPVYDPAQIERAGIPGFRQRPNDEVASALAGVGEGVARFTSELDKQLKEEAHRTRKEQDTAAVQGAYKQLIDNKMALLNDPEHGFLSRRGKDAIADSEGFLENWKKQADDIKKTLQPEQAAAFDHQFTQEDEAFRGTVLRHVGQQADDLRKENYQAALQAAKSDASGYASRGETTKIKRPLVLALTAVDLEADAQGWSPAVREAQKKLVATDMHISALDTMVEQGRSSEAKKYLEENRGQMDQAVLAKSNIEKVVTAATVRDTSRSLADSVWGEAGGNVAKAEDLLRAKGVEGTDLFDDVMKRVQQRGSEVIAAHRQEDQPRLGRIELRILKGEFNPKTDVDFAKLYDENKGDAYRMWKAEERSQRASNHQERQLQNDIDRQAESDFKALAADKPEDAVQVDVGARYPDASVRQRNMISVLRSNTEKYLRDGRAVPKTDFLNDAIAQAKGMGIKDKTRTDKLKAFLAKSYDDWLEDPANEKYKRPTETWARKAIGDALLKGQVEGWLWNSDRYAFDVQPGEKFIPPAGAASPPHAVSTPGRVRVRMPDGKVLEGPAANIDSFLKKNPGAAVVQ